YQPPAALRHVAWLVMLPVFPLLLATYLPGRIRQLTRHPMLLAVKLWALAHLLANGNLADVLLFGSFLAWAVADRVSVKRRVSGGSLATAPSPGATPTSRFNDAIALLGGLALYGAFLGGAHAWLVGVSLR
ncbi:MAG TPA: NnrU family protein, partial [Rubrivivax sp.]|nr:NnrU family protein [Rubrivivax sp.]